MRLGGDLEVELFSEGLAEESFGSDSIIGIGLYKPEV